MTAKPKVFYTATAKATGDGRKGHVESPDGLIDLDLVIPNPITTPKKANPELLFASGYSACYNSAFQSAAKSMKIKLDASHVTAKVGIGPVSMHEFALAVTLEVEAFGIDQATAELIAAKADTMCPYSNAVRGNIEVEVRVTAVETVGA
ncbi:Ohr family peroxiredoxin [Demequina sp. NBRC 110054]|uniref:Ohr family peroxiredoxin n=1 Tax=Demequina sp. NBRC 110054 TaxID=1570343 RepID=UPI000A020532|nr:Ohr family peroxiredoxin [Demequina sp. NBRC 110054]